MSNEAENVKLVEEAAARCHAIVLSLPSSGMFRHHKSRFLDRTDEGYWVESVPSENVLLDELIAHSQPIAVSFKTGNRKVSFTATLLKRDAQHAFNSNSTVQALLLSSPAQVKAVQRRSSYRVHVGGTCALSARMWRIPDHVVYTDPAPASAELRFAVNDLSVGGMGITLTAPTATRGVGVRLVVEQRVRIELTYEGKTLLLEGRLKYVATQDSPTQRVGVEFKKLENDLQGRQTLATLTKIVGEMQRDEARRMRLGLAG